MVVRIWQALLILLLILGSLPSWGVEPSPAPMPTEDNWFSRQAIPGNTLELLPTGADMDRSRRELITQARESIYLSTYIFFPDDYTSDYVKLLCSKANEGVDVRLLIDGFGSKKMKKYIEKIRGCGSTRAQPVSWAEGRQGFHRVFLHRRGRQQ